MPLAGECELRNILTGSLRRSGSIVVIVVVVFVVFVVVVVVVGAFSTLAPTRSKGTKFER